MAIIATNLVEKTPESAEKKMADKKAKWERGDTTYTPLLKIISHRGHPVMKPENEPQNIMPKLTDSSSLKK